MKIIHLLSDISRVNYGIWNAALNTSAILKDKYGVISEAWYPDGTDGEHLKEFKVDAVQLDPESWANPEKLIRERKLSQENTIIHSHGCWMSPTRLAYKLKQQHFMWVYSPHGMLEPWSRQQKKIKKEIYFRLFEKKYALKSNVIRAVGSPEKRNLVKLFPQQNIVLIPNGIDIGNTLPPTYRTQDTIAFVFLSRLHHKKGLIPLLQGWINSSLFKDAKYQLNIAGPDDGEKMKMDELLKALPSDANVRYVGAVYDQKKIELLSNSTFFILPSFSEGFPTSIVEAMSMGCIPVITDGCNFPEVFRKDLAIRITPKEQEITTTLNQIKEFPEIKMEEMSAKVRQFVSKSYSLERIADLQFSMYKNLLVGND